MPAPCVNVTCAGGRLGIRDAAGAAFVNAKFWGGPAICAAPTSTFGDDAAEFVANPARNAPRFALVGTTARALLPACALVAMNFPFAAGSEFSGVNLPATSLALIN